MNIDKFLVENVNNKLLGLLLESEFYTSSEFLMKLSEISKMGDKVGEIATEILDSIGNSDWHNDNLTKQNYFDVTDKEDTVSFIQSNKVTIDDSDPSSPYTMKGRNEIKIGKVIKVFSDAMNMKLTNADIEKFVNAFKSTKKDTKREFKFIKGEDIAKYYNIKNYFLETGTLGFSCMADEKDKVFKLYIENEKKVQLLVLVDGDDKVHGRALVWKLEESPCKAKYFMDRVYTNSDSDFYKFKQLAEEKGFLYKKDMTCYIQDNVRFVYKNQEILGEITVKLEEGDFKKYPFVDTMCFLDKKKKRLSNIPSKDCYMLHSVSGECEYCDDCEGEIIAHDFYNKSHFCGECAEGLELLVNKKIKNSWTDSHKK